MAKKTSKRNRTGKKQSSVSSVRPRSYSDMFKDQAGKDTLPAQASKSTTSSSSRRSSTRSTAVLKGSESVSWENEYAYVLKDLRWLIILSAVLLAAIVVAGFFL